MCGIYGIIGLKNDTLLKQMGRSIAHRGPDDQKEILEGNVGLGYRRLAIIDTKGSFQPLYNEDKSITLFFNGEIYNFRDLRAKMHKHKFQSAGDGETIIHHYEENGPDGFKDLNGIFGFSLLDKKKNKLILARDHFGVKPLYYFANENIFVFSSEIKAILPVLKNQKIKIQANDGAVEKYLLTRLHDDGDETFFKGIKRLPQASFLELDVNTLKFKVKPYWTLRSNKQLVKTSEKENIAEFKRLFLDSIKLQLSSEVPIGTALSGGLDSSAVVMAVNKQIREGTTDISDLQKVIGDRQKTFSARFPSEANDEDKYINIVLQASGVDSHLVKPKREEMWQDLETLISFQDEPMISSGPYAQWKVAELAKQNKIKVLLDGQGADEMLAGYIAYYFVYLKELMSKGDFVTLLKETILSADVLWPFLKEKLEYKVGIKKTFNTRSLFNISPSSTSSAATSQNLNDRLIQDLFQSSLPSLLRYEDHNSMAHSIEARVPFLDYRLVEFVSSLPSNYKIRNGWNKWIMREALKGLLPEKIRTRRWKVGFTTPEISWIRNSATEVRKIINSQSFNSRPFWNQDKIRATYEEFVEGKNDESMVFWRIINLELWFRIFIDKK